MSDMIALVTLILAAFAVGVPLVLRRRDRIDIRIVDAAIEEGSLVVRVRNAGGTPTRVAVHYLMKPTASARIGSNPDELLPGRTTVPIRFGRATLEHGTPRELLDFVVVDVEGRRSKPYPLADDIRTWIAGG